jgi:hypothetical protein
MMLIHQTALKNSRKVALIRDDVNSPAGDRVEFFLGSGNFR